MMKVVLALCFVFAFTQAAHQTYWYAGSVNATQTPQARAVDVSVTANCALRAGLTGYRNFTVNVTSAGFFYFTALFEKVFKDDAQIQVYSGFFDPTNACTNLISVTSGQDYVPHIEFLLYLTVGLYQVVVTGADNTTLGLFAIHVDLATINGAVNEVSYPYTYGVSNSGPTCSSSSSKGPYVKFDYFQNGTVSTDILFFGYNSSVTTSSWYLSAAVFNTSALSFVGQGNFTDPVDYCDTASQNFVYGVYSGDSDLAFNLQNTEAYQAAAILGINLVTGNYSFVVSTSDSTVYNANFGVFMRPTYQGFVGTLANFAAPQPPSTDNTFICTPGASRYWAANPFTAQYNAYILDNPTSGFFDASGSLYKGLNLGNATDPPVNCPGNTSTTVAFIQCGDTGDGGPVANFLIPGANYTWVQYGYSSGSASANSRYLLYNYSGKLLGNAPVTTTGPATTGVATTAAMDMSTSSASSVVVMFALYIAAMLF